ncbi:MAG: hypothetical protein ACRDWS_10530, partial [Acidimicrobiia bacterium]
SAVTRLLATDPGIWGRGVALRWIALFLFVAFLALIALGVALLWRRGVGSSGGASGRPDEAIGIIRMRYARGELTREEFLQASHDLGGPQPSPSEEPSE